MQPKILNYFDKNIFDYAGGSGGHMDMFCYPFARGRLFLEQEKDKGQYDTAEQCFWASGTSILVRKDLFIEAGEFDKVFFAHMEEIDLCWRIKGLNFSNYLNFFFTVLWIVVLMNSINFIDNMDGFAAVNSAFICICLLYTSPSPRDS